MLLQSNFFFHLAQTLDYNVYTFNTYSSTDQSFEEMKLTTSKYEILSYTHANGVYQYLGVYNKLTEHLEVA